MSRSPRAPLRHATLAAALLLPLGLLFARGSGVITGEFEMPTNIATSYPSCGKCHDPFPNSRGVVRFELTTTRSFPSGSTVPVTATLHGGTTGSTRGGFHLESDRGQFLAGTTTRIGQGGLEITHTDSLQRSWSFSFRATSPGLVQWHGVGNTVNGDGRTSGDSWGFYGADSAVPGEPFRAFANATSVVAFGSSCAGESDYRPLLGMAQQATLGQSFATELYDVPRNTAAIGVLGLSRTSWSGVPLPLDLGPLGATGCSLYASLDVVQVQVTTGRFGPGQGSAQFTWPLPALPGLRGAKIWLQALTLDPKANAFGLTTSHSLEATLQ